MLTTQILAQLIVILVMVQVFGYLCRFIRQQWVVGEILAGIALGPSFMGAFLPGIEKVLFPLGALPTLETLGDIGLILYMFSLGSHIDIQVMLSQSRKAALVSLSGIILPLIMGAATACFLYAGLAGPKATYFSFTLLVGTAMAMTAFPVMARILTERHMQQTSIGMLAITCAAVGDIVAWCLLALVIAIAHSSGFTSIIFTTVGTIIFIITMFMGIRPLLQFANRRIHSESLLLVLVIVLLLLSAYITAYIGIHPVFGAFMMGLIVPRKKFLIKQLRNIDLTNSLLFLPLYFVYTGLRTQIGLIGNSTLWLICLFILVIACVGKIFGCAFAAHATGESWHKSLSLGLLMNTRGLVELIVLNIGLDAGILSPTLFAMLVIMAILTTMIASPFLSLLDHHIETPQRIYKWIYNKI